MKEIGGYFQFEELIKNEYYKDLIAPQFCKKRFVIYLKSTKY